MTLFQAFTLSPSPAFRADAEGWSIRAIASAGRSGLARGLLDGGAAPLEALTLVVDRHAAPAGLDLPSAVLILGVDAAVRIFLNPEAS